MPTNMILESLRAMPLSQERVEAGGGGCGERRANSNITYSLDSLEDLRSQHDTHSESFQEC